jgi:7-carboxy-7-deazaguanine synthase
LSNTLPVSEIFGPTIQGEGPYAGRRAMFIRFGGCNLSCRWCDTPYTWDASRFNLRKQIAVLDVATILRQLPAAGGLVVLTGGEPLLFCETPAFMQLLQELHARRFVVHIESNGTIVPPAVVIDLVDVFVLSPKLDSAGPHRPGHDPRVAWNWASVPAGKDIHLKFVCADRADVLTAATLARSLEWPRERTWVMPLGTSADDLRARWNEILSAAVECGLNATQRLHILAWGDVRGK